MSSFLQFLYSGLTVGAIYALAALGYSIIYNASRIINFAQGEFIMLGGMLTAVLVNSGLPLLPAIVSAVILVGIIGGVVEKLAIEPAHGEDVVTLIILTLGSSLVLRGTVQVMVGKGAFSVPAFSGDAPLNIFGATLLPQSLWVVGIAMACVIVLGWFFERTLFGKAMLATSYNRLAAELVGIDVRSTLRASFVLSALLGALGGAIVAPITFTSYDVGIMLGLKGFVAATLGGLGSGKGAIVGGLLLGIFEAMTAGYLSSAYKDAMPFVLILAVMFVLPRGLYGARVTDRV